MTGEAVQHLLLHVKRCEERALAPEEVDVAAESGRGFVGADVEVHAQRVEFLCVERPRVALRGEDGRPRRVERAQGLHQRRVVLGLGQMVEIVGILAQVDESSIAGTVRRVRPRHDKDRIVCGTFGGPFGEHY